MLIRCSGRTYNASSLQVRLGGILFGDSDPDAVYANVSHVIQHPSYNRTRDINDIGLLRLTNAVRYTDTILPICLPKPNVTLNQFKVCVSTGFGRTSFNGLLQPFFYFVRQTLCGIEHGGTGKVNLRVKMPYMHVRAFEKAIFGMWGRVAKVISGVKF